MNMRKAKPSWKSYTFWVLLAEGAGALSGWLTREGVKVYQAQAAKPPLTPPALVFPIVWTGLFALMAGGAHQEFVRGSVQGGGQAHDNFRRRDGISPFNHRQVFISNIRFLFYFRLF